jgi:Zn-dependent protease
MHTITSFTYELIIFSIPVLIAITFHEVAHGYVAYLLGDPTAKSAGRLTLNPIKHLDPIGAIALLVVKVGWAKPVPINPMFFKKPRRDLFLVSFAGPLSNFFLAILFSLIIKGILIFFGDVTTKTTLTLFSVFIEICSASILVNVGLGVFNLLPIPPLDGSNMIMVLMPKNIAVKFNKFGRYGFFLIILLFFTGIVQRIILPIVYFIVSKLLPG